MLHSQRSHCRQYLYVLGTGSTWDNNELRYSLRSLERFCPQEKRVYIAGERPEWIRWGKWIAHIPLPEIVGTKVQRVGRKLIGAVPYLEHPDFVLMNDDFILTREHDCRGQFGFFWGRRHRGSLVERVRAVQARDTGRGEFYVGGHGAMYLRAIRRAYKFLRSTGRTDEDLLAFDVHVPIDLSVDLVLATAAKCEFWRGLSFRTVYGNLHACDYDRALPAYEDVKAKDLPPELGDSLSLSSNVTEAMRAWLVERFPRKSRWEL